MESIKNNDLRQVTARLPLVRPDSHVMRPKYSRDLVQHAVDIAMALFRAVGLGQFDEAEAFNIGQYRTELTVFCQQGTNGGKQVAMR